MTAEGRSADSAARHHGDGLVPPDRGRAGAAQRTKATALLVVGSVAFAVSVAGLVAVFVTWSAELWSMVDLQVYMWGGRTASLAGTPYQGSYAIYHLHLSFTYPPMAAGVFELFADVPIGVMKWLISCATVVSLAGVMWLSLGRLGYRPSPGRLGATLFAAAVALWLEPVQQTLAFGQVNAVLMLIVVADLCLPDRCWLKGVGVGLAAGFKLTPLIFVPYLLLTRRYRGGVVALGTFGLTIATSFLLLPEAASQFWAKRLFLTVRRVGRPGYVGNQSLFGAAIRLFGSARAAHPYWIAVAIAIGLAGLLLAAWLSRRGHELAGVLTCALTGLLVSPVSWSHHWVWIAPTLVLLTEFAVRVGTTAMRPPRRLLNLLAVGAAALAVVAVLALYLAYPFHVTPGAPRLPAGLIWTVAPPAVEGSRLTGYQQLTGNLYVLAGLIGLLAVAAWLLTQPTGRRRRAWSGRRRRGRSGRPPSIPRSAADDPPAALARADPESADPRGER